jgi:hypothetical protein
MTAFQVHFDRLGRMRLLQSGKSWSKCAAAALCLVGGLWLTGCGTPGAPQAPSLKLPEPVSDLTAVRTGNNVTLHWTMPKKTTDHLLLASQIRGPVPVRVCVRDRPIADCQTVGEVGFAPGIEAEFHNALSPALASGEPRQLIYFVELKNKNGRSAGLSNSAVVAAGTGPVPVTGLASLVRADGVALHWNQSEASKAAAVRLHRKLLTPPAPKEKKPDSGPLNSPTEPILRDLLVDAPAAAGALDSSARFGEVYEYTAQRVERITVDGKALELAGEISAPIRVDVVDTFPPAVPSGLVAVTVPEEKSIDLSWQPDTDEDLAGYIVYRVTVGDAENGNGAVDWIRISGAQPVIGPAYRDTTVVPGRSYRYAVSAIDLSGHESKRSPEAGESVSESEPNL